MTHIATVDIARVGREEIDTVSSILARAFDQDPVFRWLIPDPHRRKERLPSLFAAFVDLFLPHDETYMAGDGLGAALWAPAEAEPFSEEQLHRLGERMGSVLGDDAGKAADLDALLDEHHPAEASFYLQFMGVAPQHQGRGLGGRMLATVLERCDAAGTPGYLEATSRDNRRLYERHGFVTMTEIGLPDGPPLWSMWREPQTRRD